MSTTWKERYSAAYMGIFGMPQLELVRGEGSYVWDESGKRYLDLLGGIAVNVLGHAHPAVVATVGRQAATLMHVSNFFTTPTQIALAERLVRLAEAGEGSRALLVNSGTEATEAALKMALRHRARGRMLALTGSFHGRSLGALSVTHKPGYREPFEPYTSGTTFVAPGDLDALRTELARGDVAALFVEVIQGEAGVVPVDPTFLSAARDLTRAHGALLVVDEVQTGIGRTGRWFAHQAFGWKPDVMTLAKGLGTGFPIGAVIGFGPAGALLGPGEHGTTFGGNPLASAVALAVLREVEPLLDGARLLGHRWRTDLAGIPGVVEVRGAGMLLGIELDRESAPVAAALREAGFLVNAPTPTALRLAPPLTLSAPEADGFTAALAAILRDGPAPHPGQ